MRAALAVVAAWYVMAGASLALALASPHTSIRASALGPFVRATLCAEELAALFAVVVLVSVPCMLLRRRRGRVPRTLGAALLAGLCIAWTLSWESFHTAGRFADTTSLGFGAVGGWQLAAHAMHLDPWLAIRVPVVSMALAFALAGSARWMDRASPRLLRATAFPLLAGPLVALALACAGPRADTENPVPLADPEVGMVYTDADLEATLRAERTGPLTALVAPWRARRAEEAPPEHVDAALPVTWRAILPIDDWARAATDTGHASAARPQPGPDQRPNVLLVVVESLRRDQLVCSGGRRVVMPALEALAARGTVYTRALACATHSNYADPTLLSGQYPLRMPRTHVYAPTDPYPRVLLHDLLSAVGYRTAIVSSQDERWGGMLDFLATPRLEHLFHAGNYDGPTYVPREDAGFAAFARGERRSGKIDDRYTVAEAIRWIDVDRTRPFFMYLNLQNSHLPYEVPADFARHFTRGPADFPITFGGYPRERANEARDHYADALAYVDAMLARVLDRLATTGLDRHTIVVVTGDTGQSFGDKGVFGHAGPLFDEQLAVPLVIAGPGRGGSDGARDARPALHLDVPPTVLALLDLPPHPSFQGESLTHPATPGVRHRYLVAQSPLAHQYGVVRGTMKLVYDARAGRAVLFDHARDPKETHDAAADNPEVTRELWARLDTWRARQLEYYADRARYAFFHPPRHGD